LFTSKRNINIYAFSFQKSISIKLSLIYQSSLSLELQYRVCWQT